MIHYNTQPVSQSARPLSSSSPITTQPPQYQSNPPAQHPSSSLQTYIPATPYSHPGQHQQHPPPSQHHQLQHQWKTSYAKQSQQSPKPLPLHHHHPHMQSSQLDLHHQHPHHPHHPPLQQPPTHPPPPSHLYGPAGQSMSDACSAKGHIYHHPVNVVSHPLPPNRPPPSLHHPSYMYPMHHQLITPVAHVPIGAAHYAHLPSSIWTPPHGQFHSQPPPLSSHAPRPPTHISHIHPAHLHHSQQHYVIPPPSETPNSTSLSHPQQHMQQHPQPLHNSLQHQQFTYAYSPIPQQHLKDAHSHSQLQSVPVQYTLSSPHVSPVIRSSKHIHPPPVIANPPTQLLKRDTPPSEGESMAGPAPPLPSQPASSATRPSTRPEKHPSHPSKSQAKDTSNSQGQSPAPQQRPAHISKQGTSPTVTSSASEQKDLSDNGSGDTTSPQESTSKTQPFQQVSKRSRKTKLKSPAVLNGQPMRKPRKPYTITKSREVWTKEEHSRFVMALQLYDRDWKKIEAYIGSKTVLQIRSHAQKHFGKVTKYKTGEYIPPPRPKKRAVLPYPRSRSTTPGKNPTVAATTGSASGNGTASDSGVGSDNCRLTQLIRANENAPEGSGTDNMLPDANTTSNDQTPSGLNGRVSHLAKSSERGRLSKGKDINASKEIDGINRNQSRFYGANTISAAPITVPASHGTVGQGDFINAADGESCKQSDSKGRRASRQSTHYREQKADGRKLASNEKDEVRKFTGKRSGSGRSIKRYSPKRQVLEGVDGSRMRGRSGLCNEDGNYGNGESPSMELGLLGANNSLLVLSNCVDMMSRDDGHESGSAVDWTTAAAARRAHRAKVIRARKPAPFSTGDEIYSEPGHAGSRQRGTEEATGRAGGSGEQEVGEGDAQRDDEEQGRRIGSPPVATEAERADEHVRSDPQRSSAGSGTPSDDVITGFTSSDRPSVSDLGVGSSCEGSGSGGSLENSDSGDNDEDPKSGNDDSGDDVNRQSPLTGYSSPADPNSSVSRENSPNRNSDDRVGNGNGLLSNDGDGEVRRIEAGNDDGATKAKSGDGREDAVEEKCARDEQGVESDGSTRSNEGESGMKESHGLNTTMGNSLKMIIFEDANNGETNEETRDNVQRCTDERREGDVPMSKGIAHLMNASEGEHKRERERDLELEKSECEVERRGEREDRARKMSGGETHMKCEARNVSGEGEMRGSRERVEDIRNGGRWQVGFGLSSRR